MKHLIGITQRVVQDAKTSERRDVLDQAWHALGSAVDIVFVPIPNSPKQAIAYAENLHMKGLVFSGGNNVGLEEKRLIPGKTLGQDDVAYERDKTELALVGWAIEKKIPVLGVCHGFEFLNAYFGGALHPVENHAGTSHELTFLSKETQDIFGNKRMVRSFHDFAIQKTGLAESFKPFAIAEDGTIEGARHTEFPLVGVMWHPEREQSDLAGHQAFMNYCFLL